MEDCSNREARRALFAPYDRCLRTLMAFFRRVPAWGTKGTLGRTGTAATGRSKRCKTAPAKKPS